MIGVVIAEHYNSGSSQFVARPIATGNLLLPFMDMSSLTKGAMDGCGGDQDFNAVIDLNRDASLSFGKGDMVLLYAPGASDPFWSGVISETPRMWTADLRRVEIYAKGMWITLVRRLLRASVEWANYDVCVSEMIAHCLRALGVDSKIAIDLTDVAALVEPLGNGYTYTAGDTYLSEIVKEFVQFGNDDSPP